VRWFEPSSVLDPDRDPLSEVLDRLVIGGALSVCALCIAGAVLTAARGMWVVTWTFIGIGLLFGWQLYVKSQKPGKSLSRRLSRRALQEPGSPPNTRLEPTRKTEVKTRNTKARSSGADR
jgi:hypothetical protein